MHPISAQDKLLSRIGGRPDAETDDRDDDCGSSLVEKGGTVTTLIGWAPFRELDAMDRRMRRMLEDFGFGACRAAIRAPTERGCGKTRMRSAAAPMR